jgi:geranylgeranyl pyrophosphate synthase
MISLTAGETRRLFSLHTRLIRPEQHWYSLRTAPICGCARSRSPSLWPCIAVSRRDGGSVRPNHRGDISQSTRLIAEAGGRDWAVTEAARQRDLAFDRLATARPSHDGGCALALIVDLITRRES